MVPDHIYVNGVKVYNVDSSGHIHDVYVNGEHVFSDVLYIDMPAPINSNTISLESFIAGKNPLGRHDIVISNSHVQPKIITGNLSSYTKVSLINTGEIQGNVSSGNALEITSAIYLDNSSGWIKGAGGDGGYGGKGGTGGRGGTGGKGADSSSTETINESRTNTDGCAEVPTSGVVIWYSHTQNLFYWDGSKVYDVLQNIDCTPLTGGWKYCGGGNQQVCGSDGSNYETYNITRSKVVTTNYTGGAGGAGGLGSSGGNGGTGGNGRTFSNSTLSGGAKGGIVGGNEGTDGSPSSPAGGYSGGKGGSGGNGGLGKDGSSGGSWGEDGASGLTGSTGNTGGRGYQGGGGGALGAYGSAGTGGAAGGTAGSAGKSITGSSLLLSGSDTGGTMGDIT